MVTKLKSVDVVVVGVGVTGSIVCKMLAETGLKVVGLERGRMVDTNNEFAMPFAHDELKYDVNQVLMQDLSRETLTFRNAMNETALPMREYGAFMPGECVGGAAMHWGGATIRALPWDFETRSRTLERYGKEAWPEDCTSQDWGLTYDELEPYFDQFEYLYGTSGKAGNLNGEIQPGGNPFEGPRSREFPNPPHHISYAGTLFADAAKSLGYTPYPKPSVQMPRPYTNPYKLTLGQCVHGGFCSGHGCAMGAKGNPMSTVIPALLKHDNFELRPLARVIKVNLDSEKKRAVSVTYLDARGREIEQPADLVILTSYALNNTRLMLLSGIGEAYDPVSKRGVVGRNYSYQAGGKVSLYFDDKVFNRFMGGGCATILDDFNGDNFDHTGLGFIGGGYINVNSSGAPPIGSHPVPPGTPRWGSRWKHAVTQYYDRTFKVTDSGGCQSYRTNYLDLDPTYRDAFGLPLLRMTFDWKDNEKKMSVFLTGKEAEIAKAIGPAIMNVSPVSGKFNIVPSQSTHNMGGAVMGTDPATSAVNKYMQSWDVSNVFVVGGSAFPQNGGNPPTSTIGALACWAGDAIKEYYLKRPGALV